MEAHILIRRLLQFPVVGRVMQWDWPRIVRYAAATFFMLYMVVHAWVSEDAYITLRVLDNFFHGYGLRWNVNERVQSFTHPLWLLLHIPLRVVIHNVFLVSIFLSLLCTLGMLWVTLACARRPLPVVLCCLYLPLFASQAFLDYASSGLENPLSHLLFATFGYVLVKQFHHRYFWFFCALAVSLSLFNRLDTIILYAPTLAWLGWTRFRHIRYRQVFWGVLPLLLWLSFSLFYYGFLFPNTKYAKLDTDLEAIRYIRHGLYYAFYTLVMDSGSAFAVGCAVAFIIAGMRSSGDQSNPMRVVPLCLALGICWYVLYVINIGGDYMIGRFWSLPVFASIWLTYVFVPSSLSPRLFYALVAALVVVSMPYPVLRLIRQHCPACMIEKRHMIDARYMFGQNKLVSNLWPLHFNAEPHHKFVGYGQALATQTPPHVEKAYYVGMLGYYAGPAVTVVDELGLADALVARLPVPENEDFYIGHFRRNIPPGYIFAIKTGSTEDMDPSLAQYYEKLKLITSGPLWDTERLKTIIEFNLGAYDHWKQDYLYCNVWQ